MAQRGNTANYADAFVELYKIASMLDIWDKKREADILSAIMQNDDDKLKTLSATKEDLIGLHSEIKAALKDANCPDGVALAVDEIFSTPLSSFGFKMSRKKLAAKKPAKVESTVERLEKGVSERPKEYTRPTETAKIKPKAPVPVRTNLDYGPPIPASETSPEYFAKLNLSSMPAEESPKTGYESLSELYTRKPNEDVNKRRFKQTQEAHKQDGVLIVPAYMNNGIIFRGDVVHMILENIAKRNTTGLSVYVGAVPLDKEQLNNIGDLAMRLVMKGDEMTAQKLSGVIFTSLYKKALSLSEEAVSSLRKTAYNNMAFESPGTISREVVYPIRPESNILQYAHQDRMVSIDRRSLSGVLMRADVKQQVLQRISLQRPLGKTAEDLKIYYVKLLEATSVCRAAKFKKACKDLYNVDCGDLDDKILDMAHEKSVTLKEIENALFPTQEHQQKLDTDAATSRPSGAVSDEPVKLSFIDIQDLMDKYVTAKRKKAEDKKEDKETKDDLEGLLEVEGPSGDIEPVDAETAEVGSLIPEGVGVLEVGGPPSKINTKNMSISISTNPDTGKVKVYLNGSLDKEFGTMEEAIKWSSKVSEIFNNVLESSSDVTASFKFSDLSKIASISNGVVSHVAKLYTYANNLRAMMEAWDDLN